MKKIILSVLVFLLPMALAAQNKPSSYIGTNLSRGTELRVLRLAVSCAGEFTQSVAGANDREKVNEVLRQMKAWLQEINITYGREYCVRFELIPDDLIRSIIFTNAANDPWPNMSGSGCDGAGNILDIQAKVIDELIGVDNYDFSHVILGNINGGCGGGFKTGYSGDFDIGVTRHEMGHQFQQSHTINYPDNNNYEPENAGRSIQGGNTHPFAHSASFHQLALHLLNFKANAGVKISTGNHVPTVNAGQDRAIPVGTPFILTTIADDSDAGDQLTYAWDQLDMGMPKNLPNSNDSEGAIFSRLVPSSNPTRTFPNMDSIIANRFSTSIEQLPTHPRELNFRLTVNDNHQYNYNGTIINASGINSDDIKITVVNNGGPFKLTSQQYSEKYTGGSTQTITWNVAGTNETPINTQNVKISLSADGGQTFPIVLSNSTINSGSAEVIIPNINTKLGRIKIEAIDNYFFSINSQNFTINQNSDIPGISIVTSAPDLLVSETGHTSAYTVGLLTNPAGEVSISIIADDQSEISIDGRNFSRKQVVSFNNTSPQTITVRGAYDNIAEGIQKGVIQHSVSATNDNNYPVGLLGEPVNLSISDAQIPPIAGVDFDEENSKKLAANWIKVSDIRNQSIMNIPLDDGTPTNISLNTTASQCGIGGCGFGADLYSKLPKHAQSLAGLSGVTYTRGTVTFTWSGLEANTTYRLFIFGLGVFGPMKQTVTISGSGAPVTFNQNGNPGQLYINDKESSDDLLVNFAKKITSTASGTITITVTPNSGGIEMSFAGLGICK